MIRWPITLLAVFALGGWAMRSNVTHERRQAERDLAKRVSSFDRYVDMGVRLAVVVADPNGKRLIPGKPKLRIIREHSFGWMLDTKSDPPRPCGPSLKQRVWYCSEDQEGILLHADRGTPGQLVYGSEGAGKTTVLAMWHFLRVLENIGEQREGGQTAPTEKRLEIIRKEMSKLYPRAWYRYKKSEKLFIFADGTQTRLLSTHPDGERIQGYNWSWAGRDEGQDQVYAHEHIESRGRSSKVDEQEDGTEREYYPQLITATAKDSDTWRTFREMLLGSALWAKQTLLGPGRSPFNTADYWEQKKRVMTLREYQRRILAMDVPPELAVYYSWDRSRNVKTLPRFRQDITPAILARYQSALVRSARFTLLCAHDPGSIYNTTEILRLLIVDGRPTWMVVGELQTKQTTARAHAAQLAKVLREQFGVNRIGDNGLPLPDSSRAAVFCDPHGRGQSDTDYETVYKAFHREGLDVFNPSNDEKIKRSARVDMVNRLLCDATQGVRLAVATDEMNKPVAPVLVKAFESLEKKPGDENPEGTQRKDETDQTHAPAALAYGLWPFEREFITEQTVKTANFEAQRLAA